MQINLAGQKHHMKGDTFRFWLLFIVLFVCLFTQIHSMDFDDMAPCYPPFWSFSFLSLWLYQKPCHQVQSILALTCCWLSMLVLKCKAGPAFPPKKPVTYQGVWKVRPLLRQPPSLHLLVILSVELSDIEVGSVEAVVISTGS